MSLQTAIIKSINHENIFLLDKIKSFFTVEIATKVILIALTLLAFYLVYRFIKKAFNFFLEKKLNVTNTMVANKIMQYIFNVLIVLYLLNLFGVNLSSIWGAAGIAGIAIGFAAQTSFSNIISGFFVLSDKSIKIGDFITVDDVSGTVNSINLLSVKVLTPDNQMIRIPNETIIKSNLINTTHFDQRRIRIKVGVAYDSNLKKVREVLLETARSCEFILADPEPIVMFDNFGASSIDVFLAVWFKNEKFLEVKNAMYLNIHENFKRHNIPIPFPQVDVHFDKTTISPEIRFLDENEL